MNDKSKKKQRKNDESEGSSKPNPFYKEQMIFQKKQEEMEKKRQEIEEKRKLAQEKQKQRKDLSNRLQKKTKRGQPNLNDRMDLLLKKIQKQVQPDVKSNTE